MKSMKDLLLSVHVVFETLNLEISRCHLADYAARAARSFLLIQPIRSLFSGIVVAVAVVLAVSSLIWQGPNSPRLFSNGPLENSEADDNTHRLCIF